MKLNKILGLNVVKILAIDPFRKWSLEKSYDDEAFESPIYHYVFPERGLEFRCNIEGVVTVIFLFSKNIDPWLSHSIDVEMQYDRERIVTLFGIPSRSSNASNHLLLGEIGAWDRFEYEGYAVRFEYGVDGKIDNISYMLDFMVP